MNNVDATSVDISMQSIVKLFLAGISPSRMEFLSSIFADESSQLALLNNTVLRSENEKYPLSRKYSIAFLKEFIRQAETHSEYVADALYDALVSLMNECHGQESFFKIYQLQNGSVVRVRENANTLSEGSTGLSHWQATYYLSQFVGEHCDYFRNKKILELGCGLGLLGLTVIQLTQPSSYVFTDYNASVLRMLCDNIASTFELEESQLEALLNGAEVSVNNGATIVRVQELDWTYWSSETDRYFASGVDVILAADVAYDPAAVPDFSRIVGTLLHGRNSSNTCAYVAHTIRNEATYSLLQSEFEKRYCEVESRPLTIPNEIDKHVLPNFSYAINFPCVLLRIVPARK